MNAVIIAAVYSVTTGGLVYRIRTNMLKAVYSESFSDELMKAKNFILQINNKITDAAETSEGRKIKYEMSLL